MDDTCYPRVGSGTLGYAVYELDISDFLQALDPPDGFDMSRFNPHEYFITSGDAIQKTKYLNKVLWKYAGQARKQLRAIMAPTEEQLQFESECWKQAGASRRMLAALVKVKGDNIFLETEWREKGDGRCLTCMPKNPRPLKKVETE